jgi:hypothetical protein
VQVDRVFDLENRDLVGVGRRFIGHGRPALA